MKMRYAKCFRLAQDGLGKIKSAVFGYLQQEHPRALTNAEIGRALGIYGGHVGHVGHLSGTALELLKADGLVRQNDDKAWSLVDHRKMANEAED